MDQATAQAEQVQKLSMKLLHRSFSFAQPQIQLGGQVGVLYIELPEGDLIEPCLSPQKRASH